MQQVIAMRKPKQEVVCALDHLVKARDSLQQGPFCEAEGDIIWAINSVRYALMLLDQNKEEPCKKLEGKSEK